MDQQEVDSKDYQEKVDSNNDQQNNNGPASSRLRSLGSNDDQQKNGPARRRLRVYFQILNFKI